jgi:hypothetical protein
VFYFWCVLETKKQQLIPAFVFPLFFFANFCHMVTKTKGLQTHRKGVFGKKKKKKAHQKLQYFEGGKKMVRFRPKVRAFCQNISGFQNISTFLSNL